MERNIVLALEIPFEYGEKQGNSVGRRKGDNVLKAKDWLGSQGTDQDEEACIRAVDFDTQRADDATGGGSNGKGEELTLNPFGFHTGGIVSKKGLVDTT
jgi:hypothetical protein